jgi:hypothetical protein
MKFYEYLVKESPILLTDGQLNHEGDNGWELVQIVLWNGSFVYHFKRSVYLS